MGGPAIPGAAATRFAGGGTNGRGGGVRVKLGALSSTVLEGGAKFVGDGTVGALGGEGGGGSGGSETGGGGIGGAPALKPGVNDGGAGVFPTGPACDKAALLA